MDDPNITMEEYIRIEEEKACRNGKEALSYEPTVSLLNNNEIDFRITFDESDDKDYMVIFNKNSFSYKIIYVNDSKTDSENDNEICLRFCQTSLRPQHIDEFDLKDETSLSKYDEEEQNVLYFNDLFPFNIIYPDDLNSNKDNDDNEVNIIQSSGGADITDFEERLGRIYGKEIHRVQVFNFGGLTYLMAEGLSGRMLIEHRDAKGHSVLLVELGRGYLRFKFQLGGVRRRMSWRISSVGDFLGTNPSYTSITVLMLRLCHMLIACNIAGRSQAPKKVTVTDLFYLRGMDVSSVNIPYLLARYFSLFSSRRKRGAMIFGGQFVARLAEHFGLHIEERLQGLIVIVQDLPMIVMAELQVAAAGALEVAEGAPDVDESDHAVSVPVHAPQPPTSGPARTMA
ncbi:hypothetical protein Tco_1391490 [Tanacetum coccineum]